MVRGYSWCASCRIEKLPPTVPGGASCCIENSHQPCRQHDQLVLSGNDSFPVWGADWITQFEFADRIVISGLATERIVILGLAAYRIVISGLAAG